MSRRLLALVVLLTLLRVDSAIGADDLFAKPKLARIDVLWSGLFRGSLTPPPAGEPIPDVRLGQTWIGPRPMRETDRIPARIGAQFGVLFVPAGVPTFGVVRLRQVMHFPNPGLRNPAGTAVELKREQEIRCFINKPCFSGWLFEERWEMLVGTWKVEVFSGDTKVLEKTYAVEPDDASDKPADA